MAWTSRALGLLPVIACATAHADGESALSAGIGWASFSTPAKPTKQQMSPPAITSDVGGALSLTYEKAISSEFSLRVEGAGAVFAGHGTAYAALGDAGAVFRFDVLKYVPYAFAGVGGLVPTGGPISKPAEFVAVLGGGCDWLVSRDRSFGLEGRLASFGGDVTVFTIGLRGTVRWGYF